MKTRKKNKSKKKITDYLYTDNVISILTILLLMICAFINWTWFWFGIAVLYFIESLLAQSKINEYKDMLMADAYVCKQLGFNLDDETKKIVEQLIKEKEQLIKEKEEKDKGPIK